MGSRGYDWERNIRGFGRVKTYRRLIGKGDVGCTKKLGLYLEGNGESVVFQAEPQSGQVCEVSAHGPHIACCKEWHKA